MGDIEIAKQTASAWDERLQRHVAADEYQRINRQAEMRVAGDELTGPFPAVAARFADADQARKVDLITRRMKEREDRQMLAWHEGRYGEEARRQLGQRLDIEDKAGRLSSQEMLQRLDQRPQRAAAERSQDAQRPRGLER